MSAPQPSAPPQGEPPAFGFGEQRTLLAAGLGSLLVLAAAALAWFRGQMSAPRQVALWALLLLAAGVLLRRGWLRLFGPVLLYDLIRMGRRNRFFLLRVLYAIALLFMLSWSYQQF